MNIILAMRVYPEAQRKAQEQVDRVIGNNRLPTLSDRPLLPYVEAIVLEALLWRPIVAFSRVYSRINELIIHCARIDHRCSVADDEYKGFFIPKGAMIIGNIS